MRALAAAVLSLLALPAAASATGADVEVLSAGGNPIAFDAPVHVAAAPGDGRRLFVVERGGAIQLVKDGVKQPTPFLQLPAGDISTAGEGGLLSMAFAPNYPSSGRFYIYFVGRTANPDIPGNVTVREYRRQNSDVADLSTRRNVIKVLMPHNCCHKGGQIAFGPDGYLYLGPGDGSTGGATARSTADYRGKLLRIDPRESGSQSYAVPASNPFADGPGGQVDEVWAYGLRNPYRFSFDSLTGDLTIGDVGQNSFEEMDYAPRSLGGGRGADFGWNCFEGHAAFAGTGCTGAPNHEPPVLTLSHTPNSGNTITNGVVVRDPSVPELNGRYLYGEFFGGRLRCAVLARPKVRNHANLGPLVPGVTGIAEGPGKVVYIASLTQGRVYRLVAAPGASPCPFPSG